MKWHFGKQKYKLMYYSYKHKMVVTRALYFYGFSYKALFVGVTIKRDNK